MNEPLKVSILCITYNHVASIKRALDSFLEQKTNFKFEIIVHDDASTDGTTEIIREYCKRWPEIIVPVIQVENQYSKGIRLCETFVYPLIRGNYVAFCEGDDYWCDTSKLQRQVDFLENNEKYVACCHSTIEKKGNRKKVICRQKSDADISFQEVLDGLGIGLWHDSSLVFRKDCLVDLPEFVYIHPWVGDYPIACYLALCGKVRYLDFSGSVYCRGHEGISWSRLMAEDKVFREKNNEATIKFYKKMNEYTKGVYEEKIEYSILHLQYKELEHNGQYVKMRLEPFRKIYMEKGHSYRMKTYIKQYCPAIFKLYCKICNALG